MAIKIVCQDCGSGYQVKDEAAGKKFKCKSCGAGIPVPFPDADIDDEFDFEVEAPAPRRQSRESEDERPRRRKKKSSSAGSRTLAPAIGLYILGGLWLAWSVLSSAVILLGPAPKIPPGMNPNAASGYQFGYYAAAIVLPVVTLLVLTGAVCLHVRRMYALALFGCILASIPCCSPAFVLGIPVWNLGIVVLLNEDVKRSFE